MNRGIMKFFLAILSCLFLYGCSSHTLADYQEEGKSILYSITQQLQKIHTREQLITAGPELQKQFNQLVDVMLAAEAFKQKSKNLEEIEITVNHELSDLLRIEINRLYQIEGGRALIEKSQESALHRLEMWSKEHKPVIALEID
jgi:hypothetical protein